MPDMKCQHSQVAMDLEFNHLEDTGQYTAAFRLSCQNCGKRFRFLGLPVGLDLQGAAVTPDGCTAVLACFPVGEPMPKAEGVRGFRITKLTEDSK